MKRIGILGGTFDPIHTGHLMLAEWAKSEMNLEQIWLIPAGLSYGKAGRKMASAEDRLRMTQLAAAENDSFQCLSLETYRQGYTYSYETLEELTKRYRDCLFYFIVGADCLFTIESWKYPERIFQCCELVAAVRDTADWKKMEEKKASLEQQFSARIHLLPFLRTAVSSTEIRERLRAGKSVRYMLPDCVLSYIKEKGLYCQ